MLVRIEKIGTGMDASFMLDIGGDTIVESPAAIKRILLSKGVQPDHANSMLDYTWNFRSGAFESSTGKLL